jgi:hypothetical protein
MGDVLLTPDPATLVRPSACAVFPFPFCAGPAGIVLCWGVFLTYRVQIPYSCRANGLEDPRVTGCGYSLRR